MAGFLSPEIEDYLESRGYEYPDRPPLIMTPTPDQTTPSALFDGARVDHAIKALGYLTHTKGRWAGRPLIPAPVQVGYIIAPVFGWVMPNEDYEEGIDHPRLKYIRVIRKFYCEMPRKGAKTTLTAALSMILAFADHENGAEVVLGAASRDQAEHAFGPLITIASRSKALQRAGVVATAKKIYRKGTTALVKPVSSRGDLAHGANVHGGLVDELHVHKDAGVLEAIESGTGARLQPLTAIITTADDGQITSVYAQRRHYIEQLAAGTLNDPDTYGVVWAAEKKDDPYAEETWAKANPLYPVTPSRRFMQAEANASKANAAAKASFLRLHLGIRSSLAVSFFDLQQWDANAGLRIDEEDLKDRTCYGGLDLASVSDLTALVWLFPDGAGFDVLTRFWLPEGSVEALCGATANTAKDWIDDGWITVTQGDVTDYDYIENQIQKDREDFNVVGLGFDRFNSSHLVNHLIAENAPVEAVGQGFISLSAPLKQLGRLVKLGVTQGPMLRHGGNPVLRWMADNLRVSMDAAGNIKPDKAKSMDKIDGISAMTMAQYVYIAMAKEYESAYGEDAEVETI